MENFVISSYCLICCDKSPLNAADAKVTS